ncbi:MAG: hypothetical protein R3191_07670, partial [Anaerolineales bacterium]|nr:hypothetical protein [Anaerolineales bacterium]
TRTSVSFLPEPTEAPTEDPGECEPPTPEINIGDPVNSQVPPPESPDQNRLYFCVMIPEQSTRTIFELTGTTVPLDLYVGFPDLEPVQEGGVLYWSDTSGQAGDKRVVAEMGVRDYLFAGPYYIEVSPHDLSEASPFTLLVTVQQAP